MDTQNIVAEEVVVYKTKDYDRFSLDDSNRELNVNRVAKIAYYMEADEWMKYYPIVVGEDYVIHDGQHRWSAARMAEATIYYIIAPDYSISDVAITNIFTKQWTGLDYLNFWIQQGNDNYKELQEFIEFYPSISLASAMFVCSDNVQHGMWNVFREGLWKFGDREIAKEIGEVTDLIALYMRTGINQAYIRAIRVMVRHERYDGDRFREQLEKASSWLRPIATQQDATYVLQDIFNYHMKKDRVSFARI